MPFGDGTGPRGVGPMTGRGAGYCTGFVGPRFTGPAFGRGWFGFNRWFGLSASRGRGRGIGRGMGRRWLSPYSYYPRW
jgi:hypothetical protein